jgi:stage II sporulation protein D
MSTAQECRARANGALRRCIPALSATIVLVAACRPGEVPPAPTPRPSAGLPAREPVVRVGITVDSTAAVVTAATPFEILDGDRTLARSDANETWTVTATADGRLSASSTAGDRIDARDRSLRVVTRDGGTVTIGGRPFRGEALLLPRAGGRVTAVNVVDLEDYLLGVVPREIGRRPAAEIEAIKAQAVAARTYAIGNLGGRDGLGFDFYSTVMDQVYGGLADEDSIVSRAVRETRGVILTHAGRPIIAYYSSTCGGQTAAIEDSWPWRAPQPYLKSVSDRIPGTDSAYCSTSSRYQWTTNWTRDQLLGVLGAALRAHTRGEVAGVQQVTDISVVETNSSGRVTMRLVADGREHTLRADSVRWVLRTPENNALLNSSRIYSARVEDVNGVITGLEVRGGGWGHGIGMCQVGAMGRARAGQTHEQILTTYYTGTELRRVY